MTDKAPRRGCFKTGCFGTLGCGCLGFVLLGLWALLGVLMTPGSGEQVVQEMTQPVPGLPSVIAPLDPADDEPAAGNEEAAGAARTLEDQPEVALPVADVAGGTVVLDISLATFEIRAGRPGDPIRIEGDYDSGKYRLEQNFEESDDGSWRYELTFKRKGWGPFISFKGGEDRLRLYLPPGVPIRLEGEMGTGQSRMNLGGLAIADVDLKLGTGDHEVGFDEPTAIPVKKFLINAGVGELEVRGLGNASPEVVDIDTGIGSLGLDLTGDWLRDSRISVRGGIGETSVRVPRSGVKLDVDNDVGLGEAANTTRLSVSEGDPELNWPTLTLRVSRGLGSTHIYD